MGAKLSNFSVPKDFNIVIKKYQFLHIVPVAGNGKDVLNGGSYLGKTFQSLM